MDFLFSLCLGFNVLNPQFCTYLQNLKPTLRKGTESGSNVDIKGFERGIVRDTTGFFLTALLSSNYGVILGSQKLLHPQNPVPAFSRSFLADS